MYRPKDHIQQIADHIKKNLAKGYTLDSLKFSLMNQGYSRTSIDNAINLANKQLAEQAPPMREKPEIIYKSFNEKEEPKKSFWKRLFGL